MIRFSPRITVSEVDEELVLLDSGSGMYFSINPVGRRIFELLTQDSDIDKAVASMILEFDVEEESLRADIRGFLADLKARNLVETDEL